MRLAAPPALPLPRSLASPGAGWPPACPPATSRDLDATLFGFWLKAAEPSGPARCVPPPLVR